MTPAASGAFSSAISEMRAATSKSSPGFRTIPKHSENLSGVRIPDAAEEGAVRVLAAVDQRAASF